MLLLLCWGGIYFGRHGAWFNGNVYAPYRSVREAASFQVFAADVDIFDRGKAVYIRTCAVCHRDGGLGTPAQFPPLAGSEWVCEPEPGRLVRLVLQGLQGAITVKGETYNNTMVAWNTLSDRDLAAVLTYIRQNAEWGNNAPEIKADQIAAIRVRIQKSHPARFAAEELLKISPTE